jgi:hypothetical protein
MPRAQASKRSTIAQWRQRAALRAIAILLVLACSSLAAMPARAAQPRKLVDGPPSSLNDDGPTVGADAPLDPSLTGDPTAQAAEVPGDEPLYRPGELQLSEEQPDWAGDPACENQTGSGFWSHLLPPSNGRYRPIGNPLLRESWLNRPLYFGLLSGGVFNSNPINNHVDGTPGFLWGFRLGWDVDYFWGVETRVAYSISGVERPGQIGTLSNMRSLYWDSDILWYPWGDTQWRPFFLLGLGLVDYKFVADTGFQVHQTAFELPFGGGLKYRHNARWTFRFDVTDNLTFASGGGINAMNNVSILGSIEAHFGIGAKRSYWPWNPARRFH